MTYDKSEIEHPNSEIGETSVVYKTDILLITDSVPATTLIK
jgi:hypothetical protein